jgi:hypothetical protein
VSRLSYYPLPPKRNKGLVDRRRHHPQPASATGNGCLSRSMVFHINPPTRAGVSQMSPGHRKENKHNLTTTPRLKHSCSPPLRGRSNMEGKIGTQQALLHSDPFLGARMSFLAPPCNNVIPIYLSPARNEVTPIYFTPACNEGLHMASPQVSRSPPDSSRGFPGTRTEKPWPTTIQSPWNRTPDVGPRLLSPLPRPHGSP